MPKKPNPRDATDRNVKAGNKRDEKLQQDLRDLRRRVKKIEKVLREQMGIGVQ